MELFFVLLIWNFIVFILFGVDKYKAKKGHWRFSEKSLLRCALLFGSVGAFLGMKVFRHKTLHNKFRIGLPLIFLLHLLILAAGLYLTYYV